MLTVTCHAEGCPLTGVAVEAPDAPRHVCGGCLAELAPVERKPRKRAAE